jgi:PhnB protein
MALINPYIYFNGNAEEAFNFTNQYLAESSQRFLVTKRLSSPEYPIAKNDAN